MSDKQDDIDDLNPQWALQADRVAMKESLIESLTQVAAFYGRRTSYNALTAGLPISKEGITPALFMRAAARADLQGVMLEKSLQYLFEIPTFPAIFVLKRGHSCIVWETRKTKKDQDYAVVEFPEAHGEKVNISFEKLKSLYVGYAFYLRPLARLDDRAGVVREEKKIQHWFWSAFLESSAIYKQVIISAIMINLFALVSSLFVMNVYDRVIPHKAFDTLWVMTIGVTVIYLFDFIIKNLRSWFLDQAGRKADVKISGRLFEHLLNMTMASRPASAGVMASHMKEFETLRDFFTSATMSTLVDLPFTLLFIAFIGIIGGYLALIPLLAIPLILGLGWAFQKPLQRVTRESMHESALKNALLFESITGLETIKLHAAEGHVQRKWEELTERASRTSVKSKKLSSLAMNLALFIQQMVSNLVVVAGVYLIASGHLTMGGLVGSVILVGRAVAPLAQAAGLMTRFNQSKEGLSQLNKLMERPVERPDDKHFIAKPTIEGRIEFKNVNFKYPNQSVMALSDVSFSIEAGERVAIIGAIGSGKTTISRLLLNLFQATDGTVQLDGTDVRQIDPADLRRSIGIVQQDAQLFYGSIRDNINMGHEMVSERALVRAAEMSGVMEFIRDTQHGLDTAVGERGESLSGGQRQAVAVARALLYDPPILLLDEPTASMDPTSEAMLMKRLDQLTKGRTMILITHKGAMLQLVDKIILMDKSRVIAFGGRDEIIARLQNRDYSTQGGK